MRSLGWLVGSGLLVVLLLLPSAAAQPRSVITVKIKWAAEHEEMYLDETGRGDMGVVVEAFGEDFVCSQPFKFRVELDIKDLPKIYGSSMVPKMVPAGNAYFVFEQGKVGYKPASAGDKATGSPNPDGNLNMAWDLEGVPRKDAKFEYVIKGTLTPEGSGACSPSPTPVVMDSPPMTVRMMDRPEEANRTADDQKCLEDPSASGCVARTVPEDPPGAAGPGASLAVLGALAVVGVLRRRRP